MKNERTVHPADPATPERRNFVRGALLTGLAVAGTGAVLAAQPTNPMNHSAADQAASENIRGSQKLLLGLARNEQIPSVEAIKDAFGLPANARISNWLVRGDPPDYLNLRGVITIPLSGLQDVIRSLVGLNDSTINLKIFTNGIPALDLAQVVISNVPGEE